MPRLTEQSAKWVEGVKVNFAKASGKPVGEWVKLTRAAGKASDIKQARAWLKAEHGLTVVQLNFVLSELFPATEAPESELLDGQFAGPKAALRPTYDKLAKLAETFGDDVMVAPRKSQITFARDVTFATVRAATKDRIDLMLRLVGVPGRGRLVVIGKAGSSDPTHVVALSKPANVDAEVGKWLKQAYQLAKRD